MADHPARSTFRRQLRALAWLAAGTVLIVGGAYGVYRMSVGRPVLAGPREHDFGVVEMGREPLTLEHTFVLTNRTAGPIEIEAIKTSCGCSAASSIEGVIAPGDQTRIEATLTLKRDGRRRARITLLCGERGPIVLYLEAAARLGQRLNATGAREPLQRGQPVEWSLMYLEYDSNDRPPQPVIIAPPEIRVELVDWTQFTPRGAAAATPARWRGALRVELIADSIPSGASFEVRVGSDQQVTIQLPALPAAHPDPPQTS